MWTNFNTFRGIFQWKSFQETGNSLSEPVRFAAAEVNYLLWLFVVHAGRLKVWICLITILFAEKDVLSPHFDGNLNSLVNYFMHITRYCTQLPLTTLQLSKSLCIYHCSTLSSGSASPRLCSVLNLPQCCLMFYKWCPAFALLLTW